jgi:hypothetical protein
MLVHQIGTNENQVHAYVSHPHTREPQWQARHGAHIENTRTTRAISVYSHRAA